MINFLSVCTVDPKIIFNWKYTYQLPRAPIDNGISLVVVKHETGCLFFPDFSLIVGTILHFQCTLGKWHAIALSSWLLALRGSIYCSPLTIYCANEFRVDKVGIWLSEFDWIDEVSSHCVKVLVTWAADRKTLILQINLILRWNLTLHSSN